MQQSASTWAELPGVSLRYSLSGTGPRCLVLLHELGGSLDSCDGMLPPLEHRFRILRYDQRGAEQLEKLQARFTTEDYAAGLAGLLARHGPGDLCFGERCGRVGAEHLCIVSPGMARRMAEGG